MRELQRMLAMGMGGSLSWQISSGEITYLMQGQMSTKFGTRIAMEMKKYGETKCISNACTIKLWVPS